MAVVGVRDQAEVVLWEVRRVGGSLPPGVGVEPVSQVSLLALALVTPSELGGSIPVGGGGAAPLGLLAVVLVARVHVGAVLKEELVVGRGP